MLFSSFVLLEKAIKVSDQSHYVNTSMYNMEKGDDVVLNSMNVNYTMCIWKEAFA